MKKQDISITTYQAIEHKRLYSVQVQLKTGRAVKDGQLIKVLQTLPEIDSVKFERHVHQEIEGFDMLVQGEFITSVKKKLKTLPKNLA